MKLALRYASANVFCSKLELEALAKYFRIQRATYAYCAVDVATYSPVPGPKKDMILMVCWLNAFNPIRKCVKEAITAFLAIKVDFPTYRLKIVGEKLEGYAPLQSFILEQKAEEYVSFLGVVSQEEKIDLMRSCALYLQPTKVEGFGLAIAEAMSCGAAVLTSPVGSVPEVVGDAALLADGKNPVELASAIRLLLESPALRENLGIKARERIVSNFDYRKRKAALQELISEVAR